MSGFIDDVMGIAGALAAILWLGSFIWALLIMRKKDRIQPVILALIILTGPVGLLIWLFVINKMLD